MYPSGKSWDEVPGKMSSGKKFFHNAISGVDFAAQPYYVANVPISSEQQLVDSGTVDPGCNGELTAEGSYLYTATDSTCSLSGCQVDILHGGVVEYTDVSIDSKHAVTSAVIQQPVSIAIEANQ